MCLPLCNDLVPKIIIPSTIFWRLEFWLRCSGRQSESSFAVDVITAKLIQVHNVVLNNMVVRGIRDITSSESGLWLVGVRREFAKNIVVDANEWFCAVSPPVHSPSNHLFHSIISFWTVGQSLELLRCRFGWRTTWIICRLVRDCVDGRWRGLLTKIQL